MTTLLHNLFSDLPSGVTREEFVTLLDTGTFTLERIVSTGQATPPGEWCDQARDEWVVLLTGEAELRFDDSGTTVILRPGDYVLIPAHQRHRVERTAGNTATVWLALHFNPQ
ncbi:MAG: cupin [Nitrospirae bacterium GWD2_57_9]|nr:MAG: cupin [Nitrospirae bacterium GWD2_57_9]OGW50842.1 MAG: cupin [Nitrospirae bacterium GWC2_57_9]